MNRHLNGEYRRLIELGEKLKVPVAKETLYLLQLAKWIEVLLDRVIDTEWTAQRAATLADDEFFFKEISSAWYQITGKDFLADALSRRRPVSQYGKSITQPIRR